MVIYQLRILLQISNLLSPQLTLSDKQDPLEWKL